MLFSSVGENGVLGKIKKLKRFKIPDADFVNEDFSVDDFKEIYSYSMTWTALAVKGF
jgi:hypothetical protein